ncbi:MAG: glycosyltransferase family 2 protein [Planctomycetota bacterium]
MTEIHKNNFAIIIPAYNEEDLITSTIADIKKSIEADIIVVNDGSLDNTADKARAAGAFVLEHPFNLGYGAALQTGFMYALANGYEYAVQIDADGQHDPAFIMKVLGPVVEGEVDIAIGSRFTSGNYRAPFLRRLGMILFAAITSLITGKKITDSTSGFQALNKKVMSFYASRTYPSDYPDADVIIMLHRKGYKFKEVPVVMYEDSSKSSMHGGLRPLFYIFKMTLSIFVTLLREEKRL